MIKAAKKIEAKKAVAKLAFFNQRMFELMEYAKENNWIKREQDFWGSIDFNFRNISQVRAGTQSFKIQHFFNAVKEYKLDANYFFKKDAGLLDTTKELDVKELLREALRKL